MRNVDKIFVDDYSNFPINYYLINHSLYESSVFSGIRIWYIIISPQYTASNLNSHILFCTLGTLSERGPFAQDFHLRREGPSGTSNYRSVVA